MNIINEIKAMIQRKKNIKKKKYNHYIIHAQAHLFCLGSG